MGPFENKNGSAGAQGQQFNDIHNTDAGGLGVIAMGVAEALARKASETGKAITMALEEFGVFKTFTFHRVLGGSTAAIAAAAILAGVTVNPTTATAGELGVHTAGNSSLILATNPDIMVIENGLVWNVTDTQEGDFAGLVAMVASPVTKDEFGYLIGQNAKTLLVTPKAGFTFTHADGALEIEHLLNGTASFVIGAPDVKDLRVKIDDTTGLLTVTSVTTGETLITIQPLTADDRADLNLDGAIYQDLAKLNGGSIDDGVVWNGKIETSALTGGADFGPTKGGAAKFDGGAQMAAIIERPRGGADQDLISGGA